MLTEVFIILFLILLNGIFAASEIALVSSRKTRLELYIKKGNRAAREALKLHRSPNKFLSTIQIGITLIIILTGLYSGAAFAPFFEQFLTRIPAVVPYSENIAVVVVVIVIICHSLLFEKLVTERMGLIIPENFAMAITWPISFQSGIATPFVWLLSYTTDGIGHVLNLLSCKSQVTEEDNKA